MVGQTPERPTKLITALAARWESQPIDILRTVFPLLKAGAPVRSPDLAVASGKDEAEVSIALRGSLATLNADGDVTALFGIGFEPTRHRITVGNVTLYSCCALVAHASPYLFDAPVTFETTDPITQRALKIAISPDGVASPAAKEMIGTLVDAEIEEARSDPARYVCRHLNLFENRDSAVQFANGYDRRYVVDGQEFHATARRLWQELWS